MRVIPIKLVEGFRGKVCEHSDTYTRQDRATGKTFTGTICNPYTGEPTSSQTAVRNKFKQTWNAVAEVFQDSSKLDEYREAFLAQSKYSRLRTYIFAKEYEKLA